MRPLLDGMELPQVQQVRTLDRRSLAEHKVHGHDGSFLQNLGRHPKTIAVSGVVSGPDALDTVEELDAKFRAESTVSFLTDIASDGDIAEMRIQSFEAREVAGKPRRFVYALVLGRKL